jgi:hypothetical protein
MILGSAELPQPRLTSGLRIAIGKHSLAFLFTFVAIFAVNAAIARPGTWAFSGLISNLHDGLPRTFLHSACGFYDATYIDLSRHSPDKRRTNLNLPPLGRSDKPAPAPPSFHRCLGTRPTPSKARNPAVAVIKTHVSLVFDGTRDTKRTTLLT